MEPYPKKSSISPFEKRPQTNPPENPLMTSSLRPPAPTLISEEKYLALEKQLKKLKKTHQNLEEQHQKTKNFLILQKVDLQLKLHEKDELIAANEEELQMLKSRISFLEKDGVHEAKNYQKPLNRSMLKSITPSKKSKVQSENPSMIIPNLNLQACKFQQGEKASRLKGKSQRPLHDDPFFNQADDSDLASNPDSINEVKFDENAQKQVPQIKEEDAQNKFCGNKKCIENFAQLQALREILKEHGEKMEELYIELKVVFDEKICLEDLAEEKEKILQICEKKLIDGFSSKVKPEVMRKRVNEKVKEIANGGKKETRNPQIEILKEKIEQVRIQVQDMENDENEPYNGNGVGNQIEKMEHAQKELFEKVRKTLGLKSKRRQSSENVRKREKNEN